jgi:TAT-translocated FGD2 family F420-dependent dehydrogenase
VARVPFGTGVTCPSYRYRPAEVAHAFASLAVLYPGRVWLGLGTGEALNEKAAGGGWGPYRERAARLVEAIGLIRRLWAGEWVTHTGGYFELHSAHLYDLPPEPIPIYIAAGGPRSMRLAGEHGDGLICSPADALDREKRAAFEDGARAAGKDPARLEILAEHYAVVGGMAEAEEGAHLWRFTGNAWELLDIPDPREIERRAVEANELAAVHGNWTVSDDPKVHAAAIRRLFDAGVTQVYVHSPQVDQARAIRFFGDEVLPRLRDRG